MPGGELVEGSEVLEILAEKDLLEDFMKAVDSDSIDEIVSILESANIDDETIETVLKKIARS
jgi:hypothetical protein